MIQVGICDDDIMTTSTIETYVKDIVKRKNIRVEYNIFFDGNSLVHSVREGKIYDLIFLRIEMPYLSGIEVAKILREMEMATLIVYISKYETYPKQLIETEPFRILLKPINDKVLFEAIFLEAYKRVTKSVKAFWYTYNKIIYKAYVKEIVYFESINRMIYIHTCDISNDGKFYGRMRDIENEPAIKCNQFLRIHQSYLVNFEYIQCIKLSEIKLYDGTILPISEKRQKGIRQQICEMINGEKNNYK